MSGPLTDAGWRPDRLALAQGQAPIYIATKLFDYAGRLLSAIAEEALVRGLRRGLAEQGLRSGGGLAFLPFRDSNEAVDPDAAEGDLLTRQIYEMDVTAIRRSYAVVALLNDPQKDSGVCFEVGYGSLGSFSSKFRAQFGRSPAAFQREVRRIFGCHAPWRVLMVPECFLHAWAGIE